MPASTHDPPAGLMVGYRGGEPVGWVSVGPRVEFGRILRSPITGLAPDARDDASVWSIVCFFIPRAHRASGIGTQLLAQAVEHARRAGATTIEAYPVNTGGQRVASSSAFTGTLDLFARAGFATVAERRPGRPVVRLELGRDRRR